MNNMGPGDILIDLEEMNPTKEEVPSKSGDATDDKGRNKSRFCFEDDSLDSLSEKGVLGEDKSEHSSIHSGNGGEEDDDSSLEDSVNSSTMTRQISNAAAVVRKGHPLAFIQEVSLSVDGAEAENSHPLCCDDSPSCSSDYQIQSPSLHTLLDTGGATPNGDPGKNPSKALFQRYPFFTTPPPRKSNLSSSSTKEEEQESPSMANTLDAAHRRTTTAESPPSWSRRTLFFHRRRPATPPKRSSKSSHSTSSMRSLPLKDVTTPSRNSYPLQAVSPAYAMHPRTNHKKEPPETTPK